MDGLFIEQPLRNQCLNFLIPGSFQLSQINFQFSKDKMQQICFNMLAFFFFLPLPDKGNKMNLPL